MSALSDYLIQHLPHGWNKPRLVDALDGRLDRATVYKYLAGKHPQHPSESVLQAFAEVLPQASVVELRAAAGQSARCGGAVESAGRGEPADHGPAAGSGGVHQGDRGQQRRGSS